VRAGALLGVGRKDRGRVAAVPDRMERMSSPFVSPTGSTYMVYADPLAASCATLGHYSLTCIKNTFTAWHPPNKESNAPSVPVWAPQHGAPFGPDCSLWCLMAWTRSCRWTRWKRERPAWFCDHSARTNYPACTRTPTFERPAVVHLSFGPGAIRSDHYIRAGSATMLLLLTCQGRKMKHQAVGQD
jgi:hypothetical protein